MLLSLTIRRCRDEEPQWLRNRTGFPASNSGIVDLTLAATLTEVLEDDTRRQRLVVVADLKMPLATAASLRDLLDKVILAAQPTPGQPN
jgi:hypothetical protein